MTASAILLSIIPQRAVEQSDTVRQALRAPARWMPSRASPYQGLRQRHRETAVSAQRGGSSSTAAPAKLQEQLQQLDGLLQRDGAQAEAQATGLASSLAEGGSLRAFGKARQARAARCSSHHLCSASNPFMRALPPPAHQPSFRRRAAQVPKRAYSLEELRLNRIQPEQFLAPKDGTLSGVRNVLQGGYLAGLTAAYLAHVVDLTGIVQARGGCRPAAPPTPQYCRALPLPLAVTSFLARHRHLPHARLFLPPA